MDKKQYELSTRQQIINEDIDNSRRNVIRAELELAFFDSISANNNEAIVENFFAGVHDSENSCDDFESVQNQKKFWQAQKEYWLQRLLFFKEQREVQKSVSESRKSPKTIQAGYGEE